MLDLLNLIRDNFSSPTQKDLALIERSRTFSKFAEIDLHPDTVPNTEMGYIFEELIRRFSEAKNEKQSV